MDREKLLLLAVATVVAASGCVDATENPGTMDTDTSQTQNNTVFYTDSGFRPQTLEIQQGETVTWLDRSSGPMWVATDIHPSHTGYDGTSTGQHCSNGESDTFDQCSTGERFSFTFEKTGSFSYHNHRAAGDGGTIVVR